MNTIRNPQPAIRNRVLWLAAPTVIGVGLLVLALNMLTASAFGDLVVTISGLSPNPADPTPVTAGTIYSFTVAITNISGSVNPAEAVEFQYRAPEVVVVHISSDVGLCEVGTPGNPDDPSICSLGNMCGEGVQDCDFPSSHVITTVVYIPSNLAEGTLLDHDVRAWQFGTEEWPPSNEAHGWMGVVTEADLDISKTDDPETVIAGDLPEALGGVIDGDLLKYTITVTNTGPSDALNVVVTDTLPVDTAGEPQVVFLNSTLTNFVGADQCSADPIHPEQVTCELGYMTVSQTISFDILTFVYPDVVQAGLSSQTITNTAGVHSPTTDPDTDNNVVTQDTLVEPKADLVITKMDNPDPVVAGEEVMYVITFANKGPSTARRVAVLDQLPPKFQAIDMDGNPANGINPCVPIDPDDVVTCVVTDTGCGYQIVALTELKVRGTTEMPGDLDPREGYGFAIIAEVESAYVLDKGAADFEEPLTNPTNPISNTAYISSETTSGVNGFYGDINPDDNQDSELTFVTAQADLKISKTDTPDPTLPDSYLYYDPVTGGFVYTYTLTVENLGPSDAAKVVLYDWVPTDVTFREATTPDDIQCVFRDDGLLLCLVGNDLSNTGTPMRGRLNAGSVLTMTFSVEVDPSPTPRTVTNTAWVLAVAEDEFPFALGDPSDDPIEPADFITDTTPTADPNTANNTATVTTTVLTGKVAVDKKAYVNRSEARGIDVPTRYSDLTPAQRCATLAQDNILVLPGDEIIYCYTITNPGQTWLRSITLQDAPSGIRWLDDPADPDDLSNYGVVYPALTTLRGTITLDPAAPAINQTINISTPHNAKAVLAPLGIADDYAAIIITRTVTVEFPELGPVSGIVWQDENGNGLVDLTYSPPPDEIQTEPLQAGVVVVLLDENGQFLDSTITDADGRYAFHEYVFEHVTSGSYIVRILGQSKSIEFDMASGYTLVNFDSLNNRWYVESTQWYVNNVFRIVGSNRAGVSALPSTKYSTELPGVPLVFNSDLLYDTLALPVVEDTTKEWAVYEDDGDGLPGPGDVVEYTVTIPNTGAIEATGVRFYDGLYNYVPDPWKPATLINGSVSAAIHVYGRDPVTGRQIDAVLEPPDLAFGEDLVLRTQAPGITLTYASAIVLPEEILKGNNEGDTEVQVYMARLKIPPKGWLLRFGDDTYDPPIPVTFSLRIKYRVQIKVSKYVPLGTIILNHGMVAYNEMGVFDQRFPNFEPAVPDDHTVANKVANNHAGTPYRAWESYKFPGWPPIPADFEPTDYPGLRFDEYAEPGAALRDDDDPTWFKVEREPRRIQVPAIDNQDGWETLIQVQNAGDDNTGVIVFFWDEYSGRCSGSEVSPMGHACKWVAENGVWSMDTLDIPSMARSAIIYSVDEDLLDQACWDAEDAVGSSAAWRGWEADYQGSGEAIAVVVQRQGPNDHGTLVSSAYPGISENQEGQGPPYKYFAPYAMRHYHNLDTEIIIQNSGQRCTQIWLDYQKQGDDDFSYSGKISQLAPGESIRMRVPEVLGVEWLGSIYIESDEPLGIILDQTSFLPSDDMGTLLTYQARSYKLRMDTLFFADLVFREVSGWQASIQVQNLTQESRPTFVTVEFFDQSGDSILYVGDWVPRAGGKTFYLPAIVDLGINYPAGYVGAAVIESHAQVDYPGRYHDGQPIFVVVDLKKTKMYDESRPGWRHTFAGETQGGAYNAHAEDDKEGASPIMLPILAKDHQGMTSLIAIRNNSNCNNIGIKLEVRKGTGTTLTYVTAFSLQPGHIKTIDLANIGTVKPGFIGAGVVEVTSVEQLCDTNANGHIDPKPIMPSVVVVNRGTGPGDVTDVYVGIPWIDP